MFNRIRNSLAEFYERFIPNQLHLYLGYVEKTEEGIQDVNESRLSVYLKIVEETGIDRTLKNKKVLVKTFGKSHEIVGWKLWTKKKGGFCFLEKKIKGNSFYVMTGDSIQNDIGHLVVVLGKDK